MISQRLPEWILWMKGLWGTNLLIFYYSCPWYLWSLPRLFIRNFWQLLESLELFLCTWEAAPGCWSPCATFLQCQRLGCFFVLGFTYQAPRRLGGNDPVTQGCWRAQNCSWGLFPGWAGYGIVWVASYPSLCPSVQGELNSSQSGGALSTAACTVQVIVSASVAFVPFTGLIDSIMGKGRDLGSSQVWASWCWPAMLAKPFLTSCVIYSFF